METISCAKLFCNRLHPSPEASLPYERGTSESGAPLTPRGPCPFSLPGGETSGAGQAGFPQHTQEADRLSAGPAGRGRRQEVCQVALGEKQPELRLSRNNQNYVKLSHDFIVAAE